MYRKIESWIGVLVQVRLIPPTQLRVGCKSLKCQLSLYPPAQGQNRLLENVQRRPDVKRKEQRSDLHEGASVPSEQCMSGCIG
jgi:hypothetical protein